MAWPRCDILHALNVVDPLHQAIPAVPDGVEERSDGAEILLYAILFSIMPYAYSPTPFSNRFSSFILNSAAL